MGASGTGRPALLVSVLLITVAFVGCLGDEGADGDGGSGIEDIHVPSVAAVQAAGHFKLMLCTDGYHLASEVTQVPTDHCNHRVTKPLERTDWFNWTAQHGPGNEVSIAVNPTNPLNAAGGAKDYTVSYISDVADCGEYTVWMGTFATHDGGLTWSNDLMPGFPGDNRSSPLQGNLCNTDPVLVFDDDGTLWYSGLNYVGAREDESTATPPMRQSDLLTGSQLYFARSDDGGVTYPEMSFAAAGDEETVFNDKQWFALQPGGDHMIATWAQFVFTGTPELGPVPPQFLGTDLIVYSESLDGGETWSPEKILRPGVGANDPAGGPGVPAAGQFSMPQYLPNPTAGDENQDLAVIWWDGDKVLYAEGLLTPQGAEFGPVQSTFPVNSLSSDPGRDGTGPTEYRLSTYPVLAVDTSGGECDGYRYVIWADQPGEVNTDVQVLMRYSEDGQSWSEPITVNDEERSDQIMPWIDVDPDGGVHAVWYDKRHDPDNVKMDVYYGYSEDCGQSWSNVRVTETNFDGDLAHHQNGSPFIGDYIGLDTTAESAHIMWADTRHSCSRDTAPEDCPPPMRVGSDVYAATILKDLDARSTFDQAFQS